MDYFTSILEVMGILKALQRRKRKLKSIKVFTDGVALFGHQNTTFGQFTLL